MLIVLYDITCIILIYATLTNFRVINPDDFFSLLGGLWVIMYFVGTLSRIFFPIKAPGDVSS